MQKNTWLDIVCGLLVLLFLYTALSKSINFHAFIQVLSLSPLIGKNASWIAPSLLLTEYLLALLLFFPASRLTGLYGSVILLFLFTGYIGWMLLYVPQLPCSCGGVLQQMNWRQHLLFNLFFLSLSIAGVILTKRFPKRIHPLVPVPSREDVL